jgi:hypothetical protein
MMLSLSRDEIARINATLSDLRVANASTLQMADRATHSTFTSLPGVRQMRGPAPAGELEDATTQISAGWHERISALKDGGLLVFDIFYTAANHGGIVQAAIDQSIERFKLIFPDGSGLIFNALVKITFTHRLNGPVAAHVSLTLTGALGSF